MSKSEIEEVFRPLSSHLNLASLGHETPDRYSYYPSDDAEWVSGSNASSKSDIVNHPFAPSNRKSQRVPRNLIYSSYDIDQKQSWQTQTQESSKQHTSDSERSNGQKQNILDRIQPELDGEYHKSTGGPFGRLHDVGFILTICAAQAMSLAGTIQTIAPLPIIGEYFHEDNPAKLSWLTAGYGLAVGTFILPAGRWGDIFGHKRMFLLGYLWMGVWSLIIGFSAYSSIILMATARGFQGFGAALLVPNALALVGRVYEHDESKKNMVFSFYGASAPTGATVGAAFACLFAQLVWWPWAFWVMGMACFAAAALGFIVIPDDSRKSSKSKRESSSSSTSPSPDYEKGGSYKEHASEEEEDISPPFDALGTVLGVSGLVLFNFAWNQAPVVGWAAPYIISILVVSCVILAAFVWVEVYISTHPIVPFGHLSFSANLGLACVGAGWASFGIWTYYLWRTIEDLRGYTTLAAVAQNGPVAVSGLLASVCAGFLLNRISVQYILLLAMTCFVTGQILVATMPLHQTYWAQTFVSIVIMPWGMDMSFPSGTAIVSAGLPTELQGTAASLINTVVNYSISMGLGFAGTVIKNVQPDSESPEALLYAYHRAWWTGVGLDGLGLCIALFFVLQKTRFWQRRFGDSASGHG